MSSNRVELSVDWLTTMLRTHVCRALDAEDTLCHGLQRQMRVQSYPAVKSQIQLVGIIDASVKNNPDAYWLEPNKENKYGKSKQADLS